MRTLLVISLLFAVASAQFFRNPFAPRQRRPQQQQQQRRPAVNSLNSGGGAVHDRLGNKEYHYSWRVDGSKWTWGQANGYCSRLGGGWRGISISDRNVDQFVSRVLQGGNIR